MPAVSRESRGAGGARAALAAGFSAPRSCAMPSAEAAGARPGLLAPSDTVLRATAADGSLWLGLKSASRFGRGDAYRGGTVWPPQAGTSRPAATPALSPWGRAREGTVELEELEDFPNPFTHGVPFDRELVDLAEPKAWRAWVCACAEEERARRQHSEAEQALERREKEYRDALRRGSVPVGMPLVDLYAVSTGSPPPFISNPFWPALEAARDKKTNCWQRAEASVRARLGDRSLRAFGRPETIAAPRRWIAPHVAQYLKPAKGNAGPGVAKCGNALYVETTVFDSVGVPFDQAAVAYADKASIRFAPRRSKPMRPLGSRIAGGVGYAPPSRRLELGRLAAARRCARDTARDPREEEALAALRLALADRLRAGTLLAFRDGAAEPLPAEDFAPGGRLGDVGRWDAEPGILVRPPEPPSRTPFVAVAEPSPPPVQKKGGRHPHWDWKPFNERFVNLRQEHPGCSDSDVNEIMQQFARDHMKDRHNNSPDKKTVWAQVKKLRDEERGA
jgi:hypothetical protein